MINGRSVVALIPARGGSKGLPGKNIRVLCGRPLIEWTIERGLAATYVDSVIVSSDCDATIALAKKLGARVPFKRPAALAMDSTPTIDVVEHALGALAERGEIFDYVVLMEPTSPLREADDVDKMLTELDEQSDRFDAIISVGSSTCHPSLLKRQVGYRLEPLNPDLPVPKRRQDVEPVWFPFGVAYICKATVLSEERTFYPKRSTWFQIKRYQEYEIDDLYDFIAVEAIMQHEWDLQ